MAGLLVAIVGHYKIPQQHSKERTCIASSDDVWLKLSAVKLSVNDCEEATGLVAGLFFWSPLSFLPLSVCLKPPNRFRFGFGELREDADDDLVLPFELSVAEQGPDDDFGKRDICFLPEDGVDALPDLPRGLLSTGKLEISGAELKHSTNSSTISVISPTDMLRRKYKLHSGKRRS